MESASSEDSQLKALNDGDEVDNDSDNGKQKDFIDKNESFSDRCCHIFRKYTRPNNYYFPCCPPPSFHEVSVVTDGNGGSIRYQTTRPYYLFPLFVLINLTTMSDRAIIPGASQEFSAFCSSAPDAPPLVRDNPDAGLGLLQAAFIGGYSIAIVISGHLVHKIRWKRLVLGGLCIWWLGVLGSGNAKAYDSFYVLLVSRMASGVSEAAFHVVAPPLMQDRAGRTQAGLWLSAYLTGVPVGLAWGYVYGSLVATHSKLGWDWAYYLECILSLPLLAAMACVKDDINGGVLGSSVHGSPAPPPPPPSASQPLLSLDQSHDADNANNANTLSRPSQTTEFTLFSEIKVCLTSPVLVTLSLGYAAMIAVVASLGTFGGAFILALQLFDDETAAAICFGVAAALAGVIGTPLGGRLVDKVLARFPVEDANHGNSESERNVTERPNSPTTPNNPDSSTAASPFEILGSILPRINCLVLTACLFVTPTLGMKQAVYFLSFLFVGWTLLFATQTGITLSAMMSVDYDHRPNALAFLTLTSHVFGDVPAPILLGWIKDQLAPSCRIGADGDFVDENGCVQEEIGVRQSLAVAYAWMVWCLIFFEVARQFAVRQVKKEMKRRSDRRKVSPFLLTGQSSLTVGDDGNQDGSSGFQHYHSMFHPQSESTKNMADNTLT